MGDSALPYRGQEEEEAEEEEEEEEEDRCHFGSRAYKRLDP